MATIEVATHSTAMQCTSLDQYTHSVYGARQPHQEHMRAQKKTVFFTKWNWILYSLEVFSNPKFHRRVCFAKSRAARGVRDFWREEKQLINYANPTKLSKSTRRTTTTRRWRRQARQLCAFVVRRPRFTMCCGDMCGEGSVQRIFLVQNGDRVCGTGRQPRHIHIWGRTKRRLHRYMGACECWCTTRECLLCFVSIQWV